jgi:hypothetical protein
MILCNKDCSIYDKCDAANIRSRCIFDMGIYVKEEDDDEFLEKMSY